MKKDNLKRAWDKVGALYDRPKTKKQPKAAPKKRGKEK